MQGWIVYSLLETIGSMQKMRPSRLRWYYFTLTSFNFKLSLLYVKVKWLLSCFPQGLKTNFKGVKKLFSNICEWKHKQPQVNHRIIMSLWKSCFLQFYSHFNYLPSLLIGVKWNHLYSHTKEELIFEHFFFSNSKHS